jgi:hypothetical protein
VKDVAFMCPTCHAVVCCGEFNAEDLAHVGGLASRAGLKVLEMWHDPEKVESCSCATPNPTMRFMALMQLAGHISEGDMPEAYRLPAIDPSAPDAVAEMERVAREIQAVTGLPFKSLTVNSIPPFEPEVKPDGWTAHEAFTVDGFACRFVVLTKHNRKGFHAVIVTEHGFQIWPKSPGDCATARNKRIGLRRLHEDVVIPFIMRLSGIPASHFDKWLAKCIWERAALKAAGGDSHL